MLHKASIVILLLFNFHSAFSQIVNIESLRADQDSNGLHGIENFNIDYTRNTKELLTLTNNLSLQYKRNKNTLLFLNSFDMSLANEEILEQNAVFHLRYNYKINEWLTHEMLVQYQVNAPLRIQNRILAGLGPRFDLMKKEKSSLYYGLIFLYEYDDEGENDIMHQNGRVSTYLSYNIKAGERLSFSTVAYYQPRIDYWEDYRASVQGQLRLKIIKNLSFNSLFTMAYDAFPVIDEDIPNSTVKWTNGISIEF